MMLSRASAQPAAAADPPSALRARMVPAMPGSAFWAWAGPLLVTAFGAFLRFNRLSVPNAAIFDETYYVPDALGILRFGVEHNYVSNRNSLLVHGNSHIFTTGGEFVVHPPVGKLFIAFGEWTFGLNSFGWRFATAVIGSLAILLLARITRRMTRSTLLGCVAGLLMALDGLEFVMSRTALLDIFLMFWVLAAFGCLVVDRDLTRARLAAAVQAPPGDGPEPAGPGALAGQVPGGGSAGVRCPGGGWAPGCAWAWRWPRNGTRSGTCSALPPWSSPGTWGRGGRPGCGSASAAPCGAPGGCLPGAGCCRWRYT